MNAISKAGASRFLPLIVAAVAGAAGLYWFQSDGRKVEPQAAVSASAGDLKAHAKGALAAFLVKPDRPAAADLQFADGAGKPVKLSDWKGRVVLINLWATWCAPCRKEMPDFAELQKQLGGPDFEVVAISVDRKGAEASAAFLKETGADNLKLYVEPTAKVLADLQAIGLPVTVLVDRSGREVGRLLGPAEWASSEAVELVKAALAEPRA
jgi:thiol-disulfide isomerase/thioredoxin